MAMAGGQGRSRAVGLALLVVVACLIGGLAFFNAGGPIYNPPYVTFILTLFFVLVADLSVAVVSARAYLRTGSLNIVLLGAAVLITGLATMFAIWTLDPDIPPKLTTNQAITLNNVSILIGGILWLLSAITTLIGPIAIEPPRRKTILVTAYALSLVAFVTISVLAFYNQFRFFSLALVRPRCASQF